MDSTLQSSLETLEKIANRLPTGYSQEEWKRIAALVKDIDQTPLRIAVIGPFSSGKSSIVNALLGRPILPTSIEETTATSFSVSVVDPNVEEYLELPDGSRLPLDSMSKVNTSVHQVVQVRIHSEKIPIGFEILDTPGLSSTFEIHEKITIKALDYADVLLLVVDAKQGISRAMLDFLKAYPGFASKTYLLLNKADLVAEPDRPNVLEYNQQVSQPLHPAGVLLCSTVATPGLDSLIQLLLGELPPKAVMIKEATARKRLFWLSRNILNVQKEVLASIELETRDIDEKIREHIKKRRRILDQINSQTRKLTESIRSECRLAVVNFEKRAMVLVDTWTDRIASGTPTIGFSSELRSLWEEEVSKLGQCIEKLIGEYRTDLEGIVVDASVEVPWWTNWIDWVFAALAVLGPLTGGWGNLLEAVIGKVFGALLKAKLVKGFVRNSLQSAVIQWVSEVGRQMESRLSELREEVQRSVHEQVEPQIRETEDALAALKEQKEKKILDVKVAKKAVEADISELERVLSVLET